MRGQRRMIVVHEIKCHERHTVGKDLSEPSLPLKRRFALDCGLRNHRLSPSGIISQDPG